MIGTSPYPQQPADAQDWKILQDIMVGDQLRDISRLKDQVDLLSQHNQLLTERIKLTFQQQAQQHAQQVRTMAGPATMDWMAQLNQATPEDRKHASESAGFLLISSLEQTSKHSPGRLAGILAPVLGPTIRSYVKAIFQQLVTQMDNLMRRANFFQRIWWRMMAAKKGMPYAEYVIMKAASFSVVHAKLMKRETSEIVGEAGSDIPTTDESDPFAAQSALASALGNQLHPEWETLRIAGESLALQLRTLGACPPHVRLKAEQVLRESETILQKHGPMSPGPLPDNIHGEINTRLLELLANSNHEKGPTQGLVALAVILGSALIWSSWSVWQHHKQESLVDKISTTPGYMVHGSTVKDGKLVIKGMKAENAPRPELLLADSGISPNKVSLDFTGFRTIESQMQYDTALDKNLSAQQAARELALQQERKTLLSQLNLMETNRKALVEAVFQESVPMTRYPLSFSWDDNHLTVSGQCPEEQLPNLHQTAENLKKVAVIELKVTPQPSPPWSSVRRLEGQDVPFVSGTVQLETHSAQALASIVDHIRSADRQLEKNTATLPHLRLRAWPITGIWQEGNRALQMERLKIVQSALINAGVDASRFQPGVMEPTIIHSRQGVWVEWMSEAAR